MDNTFQQPASSLMYKTDSELPSGFGDQTTKLKYVFTAPDSKNKKNIDKYAINSQCRLVKG
jgi:hypothetical protein